MTTEIELLEIPKKRKNWVVVQKEKQDVFLEAFSIHKGSVVKACQTMGIDRKKYNKWMRESPAFAEKVMDVLEEQKDYLEDKLKEHIDKGDTDLLKFALTAIAPERGYAQKQIIRNETEITIQSVVNSIWDKQNVIELTPEQYDESEGDEEA